MCAVKKEKSPLDGLGWIACVQNSVTLSSRSKETRSDRGGGLWQKRRKRLALVSAITAGGGNQQEFYNNSFCLVKYRRQPETECGKDRKILDPSLLILLQAPPPGAPPSVPSKKSWGVNLT